MALRMLQGLVERRQTFLVCVQLVEPLTHRRIQRQLLGRLRAQILFDAW